MEGERHAAHHAEEVYRVDFQCWVCWLGLGAQGRGRGVQQRLRGDAGVEEDGVECFGGVEGDGGLEGGHIGGPGCHIQGHVICSGDAGHPN